ncbi:ATP-binding protein [Candidatus Oscillochloris fontis]|uniref:ATP-binding protein n=1 Tax=Candidatus Oscillochloris fontis TaxID=2496868 RepID=UPI00101C6CB1|nr:ATP-binding protein [Candidatus Oscillochloris fontis]
MFVDRLQELDFLNRVLTRRRPGPAQLVLLYGRRRVGKTDLLRHWANQSGLATTFWTAEKEPAALQRRKCYAALMKMPLNRAPIFESWAEVWEAAADVLGDQRHILILDEIPYAIESDPGALSALQHAWDHRFQYMQTVIALCGSQIRVMEGIQGGQSPLFGRLTGRWYLQPLPFSALNEFFPTWSVEERIAVYAVVGGIPAYLDWLDPELSLVENIRQIILDPGSMFGAEPAFLLYDEVREPQSHLAILKAIGEGAHTLDAIKQTTLINKAHLSSYLMRLQDLKMVERRLPATIPQAEQRTSRKGRYHLSDAYFRFYFRFLAPYHDRLAFAPQEALQRIQANMRAFVGQTGFEELCRQWVAEQSETGVLRFTPTVVGSHWNRNVQVDVVAINWQTHTILLGECKWGADEVDRQVVRELIEQKTAKVLADLPNAGQGWTVQYAFFARRGFTAEAQHEALRYSAMLVNATQLGAELR